MLPPRAQTGRAGLVVAVTPLKGVLGTGGWLAAVTTVLGALIAQALQFSRLSRNRLDLRRDECLLLTDGLRLFLETLVQRTPLNERNTNPPVAFGRRGRLHGLIRRQEDDVGVGVEHLDTWTRAEVSLHSLIVAEECYRKMKIL